MKKIKKVKRINKDKITKNLFRTYDVLLIMLFISNHYMLSKILKDKEEKIDTIFDPILTTEYIKKEIYSSNALEEDEKDYLYNDELFTDILPLLNDNPDNVYEYYKRFHNIEIKPNLEEIK